MATLRTLMNDHNLPVSLYSVPCHFYPASLSVPASINQCWSIDFMSDVLWSGRKFRTFNMVDDYNREALAIEVDLRVPR